MEIVGYTVAAVFCFLFLYLWSWNIKKSAMTNWPVVGMLPALLHNASHFQEYLTQVLKQSGGTFVFKGPWFANMGFVITSDPANVHYILIKNFKNFNKGSAFKSIFSDVLGDGIFVADSNSWKFQRKLIQLLIKHSNFQQLFEKTIWQKIEKGVFPILEHVSEKGGEIDMKDLFQLFTFDFNVILLFGSDPGCLSVDFPEVAYAKAFTELEEALFYRHMMPEYCWKLQKWLQIGQQKKLTRARETLDQFLAQQISLKRELRRSKTQKGFDLVTAIMDEEEEEKVEISDKFLRDITMNLLAAGQDSVGAGLTWFFWLVAMNPSVEIKILEEIKATILLQEEENDDVQELSKLVYLHAALCESLRLYTPTPINHKATIEADILPSGHRLGRETKLLFSIYSMGRMEDVWGEDCLEFKPERWISERGEIIHIPSYKFATYI